MPPSAPSLTLEVTGDRGDYYERGSTLQRGDTAYLHNYDIGAVREMHVSKVVGRVAYNDLQWLSDQASAPTLTLQTCVDYNPKGDRYIVQLT